MLNNIEIQNKLADIFDVSLDQLHGRSSYQEDETETLMFNHLDGFGDLSQDEQKRIVQQLEEQAELLIAKAKKNKISKEDYYVEIYIEFRSFIGTSRKTKR